MIDFEETVRQHCSRLRLPDELREEVVTEIAEHLELLYSELRESGVAETEAQRQVLESVGDWNLLLKRIQRSKENGMRDRFRRLWLPATATGFVAYAGQMIVGRMFGMPLSIKIDGNYYVYSWQLLFLLVVAGAVGAYWSRHVGGGLRERFLVALAPSEIMGVVIAIVSPIGMTLEAFLTHRLPYALSHPGTLLMGIGWPILFPAVPTLLGAAPFLFGNESPQTASVA